MKTHQMLKTMKVIAYVIFIGICIRVGAILFSFVISLFVNQKAANNLYLGQDLSNVYNFSPSYYIVFVTLMLLVLAIQAYIFFLVIQMFSKFNERNPFSQVLSNLISKISYATIFAGGVALAGTGISKWLLGQGITNAYDWSADEFLFMGGVVFVVGLFYKRGVELQTENELTI